MAKNELKILIGVHRVANAIDRQTIRIVSRYGLSLGQFAVLEALYHKGNMSVGEVQKKILSTSGTIPLIVDHLEKKGYLVRQQDCMDKRRCLLSLTDAGRRLIEQVYPQNEEMILAQMSGWTDPEKELLVELLKKFGKENHEQNR